MFLLEFGLIHDGCIVNQLSRFIPRVRIVAVGGFVLSNGGANEIIALDCPVESEVESALEFLRKSQMIDSVSVVENSDHRVFIHLISNSAPEVGYCSETVNRNLCHKVGLEIQHEGVEQWKVMSTEVSYFETLIGDLKKMGDLKYHKVSREVSWEDLIAGRGENS